MPVDGRKAEVPSARAAVGEAMAKKSDKTDGNGGQVGARPGEDVLLDCRGHTGCGGRASLLPRQGNVERMTGNSRAGRHCPPKPVVPKAGAGAVGKAEKGVDARKYDEAVRMGQEVEEWGHLNDMGLGCLDPIAFVGGPPVAGVVFFCGAYFWHELWYFFGAIVVLWLVAACCRMAVRVRLGARNTEGARRALQYARVFSVLTLLAVGAAMVDFWCHLESCAEKYNRKVEEAADMLKSGLDESSRRLQR